MLTLLTVAVSTAQAADKDSGGGVLLAALVIALVVALAYKVMNDEAQTPPPPPPFQEVTRIEPDPLSAPGGGRGAADRPTNVEVEIGRLIVLGSKDDRSQREPWN